MEELDLDAQQRREAFARYGLAMYHAQCVEKSLAILVSSVFNREFQNSPPDRRGEIQDDIFSKTIGRLLARLRKQVVVPTDIDQTLEKAKKKRDWLAHNYFWDRAGELMTTRGRDKMISELAEITEFFDQVDAQLVSVYEKWNKKVGLTEAILDENLKKIIKKAE